MYIKCHKIKKVFLACIIEKWTNHFTNIIQKLM